MFSVRFTLFLLAVLTIPFWLRFKYGDALEIYPAVMLPSGTDKIWRKYDQIKIEYSSISGKDKNGCWKDLSNTEFMHPIPDSYVSGINLDMNNLNDTVYNLAGSRFLQQLKKWKILIDHNKRSETDISELKSWIRMKLSVQDLDTLQIKKVLHTVTISTLNGAIVKYDDNERIIPLDKQH